MQIIPDLQKYKVRSSRAIILAIGNFDGFHLGHQKLLRYVVDQARRRGALSAVLTFPGHPHSILHPDRKPMMIMSIEQKLFYLEKAGIDLCFLPAFTPAFARVSPKDFVEKILVKKLHVLEVCMGYDAHFGHGRRGNTELMEKLAKEQGFIFRKMEPVTAGGKPVSSTRVRELLTKGEVEKAQQCLGRPFSVFGKVVHGKGHGAHLGFPTANLEIHSEILLPLGVYIASGRFLNTGTRDTRHGTRKDLRQAPGTWRVVRGAEKWLSGVMNFGKRPTYPKEETPRPVLELYLLDFKKRIYGEMMEIAFHRFLRSEQKFSTEKVLMAKISQDVQKARQYYKEMNPARTRCVPGRK